MASVCVIRFTKTARSARVLRQVEYLAMRQHVTVIGFGSPHPSWKNNKNIYWISIPDFDQGHSTTRFFNKFLGAILLCLGRIWPNVYDLWYWSKKPRRDALNILRSINCNVILACDWDALPLAVKLSQEKGIKVVFDSPEYSPRHLEQNRKWLALYKPAILYYLQTYGPHVHAMTTVAPLIAEEYNKQFGFNMTVVMSAPQKISIPEIRANPDNQIRLVHSGAAVPRRKLEDMIDVVANSDSRYHLFFYLIADSNNYIDTLKYYAIQTAPGRIHFKDPVDPKSIPSTLCQYDLGIFLLPPNSFNHYAALPNKFFDFIHAGLGVVIGPSPSMAAIIQQYQCGVVSPDFEPKSMAKILNQLTIDEIQQMKSASRIAAEEINADTEMKKLIAIINSLTSDVIQ